MPRKTAPRLPISPATVTVDGYERSALNETWSSLRIEYAIVYDDSFWFKGDHHLSVPSCHPDDNLSNEDCGWSRLRPRDKYAEYRFAKQRNGNWMLVREATDA